MSGLTHFDAQGNAVMVDVSAKATTERSATAKGRVVMAPETLAAITGGAIRKGDALAVAQLAGIMAAKRTSELIPLCHPLPLTSVQVALTPNAAEHAVEIEATVKTAGQTGVEMEALTAVQVGLLTVYDMLKAADRGMVMTDIRVLEKHGGKSGSWVAAGSGAD
jgi:cyclic pyranopterin phosphate synthase